MILTDLKIYQLRNIAFAHLELNPRFNIFTGANGSGKTTILEAFYLLSSGHSFRSREVAPLISYGLQDFTVYARAEGERSISLQKSKTESLQVKLDNQFCTSTSQLAYALPCQIFYADIFQIIDASASVRRSLLNWGLFHVKPLYLTLLKDYKRILKQRNALLKTRAPISHFLPWNQQLSAVAEQLHLLRAEYFELWKESFLKILAQLTDFNCDIEYFKGWDKKKTGNSLETILAESHATDSQKLYTQYGAHQADIYIESNQFNAKRVLSRGQQKIILIALKLAQGALLDKPCIYLFDDFSAELDGPHQERLLEFLSNNSGQYIISNINPLLSKALTSQDCISYQVNQGKIAHVSRGTSVTV